MVEFHQIAPLREYLHSHRCQNKSIGLVPTMGALHEGHLALVKSCKAQNDFTIVSIFVNPTQFNNPDDLKNYPRDESRDLALLESLGCDAVFIPSVEEMYTRETITRIDFGPVETRLEGKFRPGHFSGVALVVSKLFHIVQPDNAYFGQKDLQQYVIINQLVNDLSFPVSLQCEPIVREESGLAMSSRNARLSPSERVKASVIYRSLVEGRDRIVQSDADYSVICREMMQKLRDAGLDPEYYEIVQTETLEAAENGQVQSLAICVAALVGEVRLIDNIIIEKESE